MQLYAVWRPAAMPYRIIAARITPPCEAVFAAAR